MYTIKNIFSFYGGLTVDCNTTYTPI